MKRNEKTQHKLVGYYNNPKLVEEALSNAESESAKSNE